MSSCCSPDKRAGKHRSIKGISDEARQQYWQAYELMHQGRTEDALNRFKHTLEISPDYPEALHETANCLQDLGRHEEASRYYSRALRMIGDRLYEIGRYEESKGRYWTAIRRYEEAGAFYDEQPAPDR
jgi:tetratricopeptide (TPR) repeat protein